MFLAPLLKSDSMGTEAPGSQSAAFFSDSARFFFGHGTRQASWGVKEARAEKSYDVEINRVIAQNQTDPQDHASMRFMSFSLNPTK